MLIFNIYYLSMRMKKFASFIIIFLLSVNIAQAYSGIFAALEISKNVSAQTRVSKSDIINNYSFKQLSSRFYGICSKVYVTFREDICFFASYAQGLCAIKENYKTTHYGQSPQKYVFTKSAIRFFGPQASYSGAKASEPFEGFRAVSAFVISVFMLFLSALYKGSVPNPALIIFNNPKTRYF